MTRRLAIQIGTSAIVGALVLSCAGARPEAPGRLTGAGGGEHQPDAAASPLSPSRDPDSRPDSGLGDAQASSGDAASSDLPAGFSAAVRAARAKLIPLRNDGWAELADNSAQVLTAVAEALVQAPNIDSDLTSHVARIRATAALLERQGETSLLTAGRIKWGMSEALKAVQGLVARRGSATRFEPWLRSAALAVASLDENNLATFQAAKVQDAFRTLCDALLAVADDDVDAGGRTADVQGK